MVFGSLELIVGNMFSGKSSELIRRINREKSIRKRILVINYSLDNRYSPFGVVTHDQIKVNCLKVSKLSDIPKESLTDYDSFFIDEAQFFVDIYQFVVDLVDNYHKHVVVSGLDGDFNRQPFGDLLKLVPMADSIMKLKSYCVRCCNGTMAPFSKKIVESNNVIDIGSENYIPVCRFHYFN